MRMNRGPGFPLEMGCWWYPPGKAASPESRRQGVPGRQVADGRKRLHSAAGILGLKGQTPARSCPADHLLLSTQCRVSSFSAVLTIANLIKDQNLSFLLCT